MAMALHACGADEGVLSAPRRVPNSWARAADVDAVRPDRASQAHFKGVVYGGRSVKEVWGKCEEVLYLLSVRPSTSHGSA